MTPSADTANLPNPPSPLPAPPVAEAGPETGRRKAYPVVWGEQGLAATGRPTASWLWQGYLAPGAVTLLTSWWKAGKTTLLSVLLSKLKTGGQLAGLPVTPGRALILTEESPDLWSRRSRQLAFGDHHGWICRPFQGKPRQADWLNLLDQILDLHRERGLSLVAIDPLAAFLPGRTENDAATMLEGLAPLQRLTSVGLSVCGLHHPRRAKSPAGRAARGSGALPSFADILIEMRWYRRAAEQDRRRRLIALSRFPETPRQLVIEWTADGTDYLGHGTFLEEELASHWDNLRLILERAWEKFTREDILQRWPSEPVPSPTTLNRWLELAVAQGLVRKDRTGHRQDPFRYWLPAKEDEWRRQPGCRTVMPELFAQAPPAPSTAG